MEILKGIGKGKSSKSPIRIPRKLEIEVFLEVVPGLALLEGRPLGRPVAQCDN